MPPINFPIHIKTSLKAPLKSKNKKLYIDLSKEKKKSSMVKKMRKASIKFSNNHNLKNRHHHHRHQNHRHRHHQLNTLRPRVYITRSSNFKTLVQELTGYDHTATNPPILPAISPPPPEAMSSFDDLDSRWLAPFDFTDRLSDELLGSQQQQQPPSFVPKTGNQMGVLQDTNMESWLLEIGPSAHMLD